MASAQVDESSAENPISPVMDVGELGEDEKQELNTILRPHLRLETAEQPQRPAKGLRELGASFSKPGLQQAGHKDNPAGNKVFKRQTVLRATIEADNKRRPGVLKRNSQKYWQPPPDQPDPNSEVKSEVIRRFKVNLEEWNTQLVDIAVKKKRNDKIQKHEITTRDDKIDDLTDKFNKEQNLRETTESQRDILSERLANAEDQLIQQNNQLEQLSAELEQYETAYNETEARRQQLEEQNMELIDKVQQIEEMKRRLNDQVTELQGQISMLERQSAFCTIQ